MFVVGQDEQSLAAMWRADVMSSREYGRNAIAHALKVSGDDVEAEGQMAGDVLEKNESWSAFANDPGDVRPQVARIVSAGASPCEAERLARVARSDEIHDSTPRAAVEGGEVVPDRSRSQGTIRHARDQDRGGMGFPLHETDGVVSGHGESDAELESANPGT